MGSLVGKGLIIACKKLPFFLTRIQSIDICSYVSYALHPYIYSLPNSRDLLNFGKRMKRVFAMSDLSAVKKYEFELDGLDLK